MYNNLIINQRPITETATVIRLLPGIIIISGHGDGLPVRCWLAYVVTKGKYADQIIIDKK